MRPKHQVAGESPAGDTIGSVANQQSARLTGERQRGLFAPTISSLWCSQKTRLPLTQEIARSPAVASERRREQSRSGTPISSALKALSAMRSLGKRISSVQLRVRDPFRSRASAQVGFISPLRPGQHRRLRGISMPANMPPRSSLRISFVKNSCRSNTGGRLQFVRSRSPTQRHDVESVASAGASPAASTIFKELKPQQTGTGLLIRLGEVATTSGSTSLRPLLRRGRRLARRSTRCEGGLPLAPRGLRLGKPARKCLTLASMSFH